MDFIYDLIHAKACVFGMEINGLNLECEGGSMRKLTKKEVSWILYDCGNSAYSMAITTAIFPIYFGMFKGGEGMDLGYFNSFAGVLVALLSPMLGTIADYKGKKMKFFRFFLFLGVLTTLALMLVPQNNWILLAILYVLTAIGFAGSNIFYDAFLVDITERDRMDEISSKGFAYGYIASVLPFLLCLLFILSLGMDSLLGYRLSFLVTALWWLALAIPMLRNVKQKYGVDAEKNIVRNSFLRLADTMKNVRRHKTVFIFLMAYFLYIDGVDTIIKMVVPYTQSILGAEAFDVVLLLGILLMIQIVAFPCALLYGRLAGRYGTKRMIQVAILTYIVTVVFAYFMNHMWQIFVLGALVASAQGGIQALSRSYYAKIIPKENANEFFGFYNIFGKFAAILGPVIMALITDMTGVARYSILGILPLFVLGFFVLSKLPEESD